MASLKQTRSPAFRTVAVVSLSLSMLSLITACSARQGYASAQSWQRNQCAQIIDVADRMRCMKEADQTYDRYKKQTDEIKSTP